MALITVTIKSKAPFQGPLEAVETSARKIIEDDMRPAHARSSTATVTFEWEVGETFFSNPQKLKIAIGIQYVGKEVRVVPTFRSKLNALFASMQIEVLINEPEILED